jgi:Arylsulfotransferase (ASST)/Secretion system C-terminal sorting domain
MKKFTIIICFLLLGFADVFSQTQTVGLFLNTDNAYVGYTLFAPMKSNTTYLINNNGELVHSWENDKKPGLSVYLLPNGNLLRTQSTVNQVINAGGGGGEVVEFDWEGNKVWDFMYSNDTVRLHHDVEYLPSGDILMIAWVKNSAQEAFNAGRNPDLIFDDAVWSLRIIEVSPTGDSTGDIVWEWNAWDHLIQDYDSTKANYGIVENHPELINFNYVENPDAPNNSADWMHTNGIDYNEELDQILLSIHNFNEIWIIDHSTTTEEAAGHTGGTYEKGGDLLYRWGNPAAYGRGTSADRKLYSQHDAEWIPKEFPGENNITIFNNGNPRLRAYSTADEIVPPYNKSGYTLNIGESYAPESAKWSCQITAPTNSFSQSLSSVQRLENGNTLICAGPYGDFSEVDSTKEIIWRYVNPVIESGPINQGEDINLTNNQQDNLVFRATRYALNYSAFDGKDLTPLGTIEINTTEVKDIETAPLSYQLFQNYPNPFNPVTNIRFSLSRLQFVKLEVYDLLGRLVATFVNEEKHAGEYDVEFNASSLSSGVYLYKLTAGGFFSIKKMMLLK